MKVRPTWFHALIVLCLAVCTHARADTPPKTVCGRLTQVDGLTVLEVWGTPQEAGFAHGYLLADRLVGLFDEAVLAPEVGAAPEVYEAMLLPAVRQRFIWEPRYEEELAGLLRGMQARLGPDGVRSQRLDRDLTVDDLKLVNSLADWHGVFCSSFAAWGACTVDGDTLGGRNLDYPSTRNMQQAQILLVHRNSESARAWVGVTWPGLIGVYTAMNDEGVTIAMHDATGEPTTALVELTPRTLTLREALEGAASVTFIDDVRRVLEHRRTLIGNNIMVTAPNIPGRPPAAVFEYDGNSRDHGVTLRLADAAAAQSPLDFLCCTNHMRSRKPPSDCRRYDTLTTGLRDALNPDHKLDPPAALRLIQSAVQRTTLHTVVFAPARRTLYVQIPALGDGAVEFNLADCLQRPCDPTPITAGSVPPTRAPSSTAARTTPATTAPATKDHP